MHPYIKLHLANRGKGHFQAKDNTIWVYDVIAENDDEASWLGGISPRQFIEALSAIKGPVTMRFNSPGGSVFGGQAMVAAMRAHPHPITARVDSLAASIASVMACEASRTEIAPGAMMMIHKAWTIAVGNEYAVRKMADLLAVTDSTLAATYARRGDTPPEDWLARMAAETWYTAEQAVEAGLADALIAENTQRPSAMWDLSAFAAAPKFEQPEPAPRVGPTIQQRLKAELLVKGI